MKTKKCGVYAALAAVLLVSAMLVLTCVDPLAPGSLIVPKDGDEFKFTPPPGKAYIRVIVPAAQEGRTIMPGAPTNIYYSVNIIGTGTNAGNDYTEANGDGTVDFSNAAKSEVFTVVAGAYTVTVSAYSDAGKTKLLTVGQGTATVVADTGASVTITLALIDDGSEDGIFSYNITLPAGDNAPDSATLVISPFPTGGALTIDEPDLLEENAGTETLPSGYYWVRVTLGKDRHDTVTYSQILHVYGYQTADWTTTLANLVKNAYDITYDLNHTPATYPGGATGPMVDDNGGAGWAHAGTTTKLAAFNTDPERTPYIFGGWHTVPSPDDNSTLWVFGTGGNKIYKDTPLYANWTSAPTGPLTVVVVPYEHITSPIFDFDPGDLTIQQSAAIANIATVLASIAIEVDDSAFDTLGATDGWYFGTTRITGGAILTGALINGQTAVDFTKTGEYQFTFVGSKGAHSFNGLFTIIVE